MKTQASKKKNKNNTQEQHTFLNSFLNKKEKRALVRQAKHVCCAKYDEKWKQRGATKIKRVILN